MTIPQRRGTGRSPGRPHKYGAKTWVPKGYKRRGRPTDNERLAHAVAEKKKLQDRDGPNSLVALFRGQVREGKRPARRQDPFVVPTVEVISVLSDDDDAGGAGKGKSVKGESSRSAS
ncbi:hypothetical protein BGX34_007528, partial [Mortierella sp. NVP85]